MPNGRFLSKSVAYSDQLGQVSLEADYLFTRMIPHLDREGRMSGSAKQVKGMCCPLRDEVTADVVERCLAELQRVGLIEWYEADGKRHVAMPGFKRHQQGMRVDREAKSHIPDPETGTPVVLPESSRMLANKLPPSEVKLSEVKVSEVKGVVAGAPTHDKPARVRPARPSDASPAPAAFHLAPYIDLATELRGECNPPAGRWGKLFKRLEGKYGRDEVLRRWGNYLECKGERAMSFPEDLATNWAFYADEHKPDPMAGIPDYVQAQLNAKYVFPEDAAA